jgi:hypothetical protein
MVGLQLRISSFSDKNTNRALSDVVMEYAYARSEHRLDADDFDPSFHDASVAGTVMGHLTKQMPWILSIMTSLPDWVAVSMNPDMASYVNLQRVCQRPFPFPIFHPCPLQ